MDALLRLRCLPDDGHRDPDRPDRAAAAAAVGHAPCIGDRVARQPEGPPPPPVVQRLRIRYAKRGRLRFTSHRDFARAFERALRRASIPMAYSAGFSPHPKISYAGAAPTGVASEAEYLEIGLAEQRDLEAVRIALDQALPPGLDVVEVVEAVPPALADRLEASLWQIQLPGVAVAEARAAVE